MQPRVIKLHYLFFFGSLGVYLPFLNSFLRAQGFTGTEIGALRALLPAMKVALPPITGPLADRMGSPGWIVRVCGFGSLAAALVLCLAGSPGGLVLGIVLFAAFRAPAPPLVDALALRELPGHGETFGRARLIGSLGFAVVVVGVGPVLDRWGVHLAPWLLAVSLAGVAAISLWFPVRGAGAGGRSVSVLGLIRSTPALQCVLPCTILHSIAGTSFTEYFTILVEDLGHESPRTISALGWLVGVSCEIAVLHRGHRILERTGLAPALLLATAATSIRWFATSVTTTPALLVALQAIHGLSFGLFFLASVTFVQSAVDPGASGTAQSILSGATWGLGSILGMQLVGVVFDGWGAPAVYATAGGVELLALGAGAWLLRPWWRQSPTPPP